LRARRRSPPAGRGPLATPGSVAAWLATASPRGGRADPDRGVGRPRSARTSGRGSGRTDRATHAQARAPPAGGPPHDRDGPPEHRLGGHGVHHDRVEGSGPARAGPRRTRRTTGRATPTPATSSARPMSTMSQRSPTRRGRANGRARTAAGPWRPTGVRGVVRLLAHGDGHREALPLLQRHRDAGPPAQRQPRPAAPAPGR